MFDPRRIPASALAACLCACGDGGGRSDSAGSDGETTDPTDGDPSPVPWPENGLLGCPPGEACTFLLVSETLDDRLEIFAPRGPGPLYRGQLNLDFKPNDCDGCDAGDNGDGRLDEPFGAAVLGDTLGLLMGHYPMRSRGSLLSFPASALADYPPGATVPVGDIFGAGGFVGAFAGLELGVEEPLFVSGIGSDRFLVSAFANDLFQAEASWTEPGILLRPDIAGGSETGRWSLADLEGGSCLGAGQLVASGPDRIAVACDGNEGVAFLETSSLQSDTVVGRYCDLPAAQDRRVRYLAPDGRGGVLVADSASNFLPENATLWWLGDGCDIQGFAQLDAASTVWALGQVVRLPTDGDPAWLFASGVGHRGLYGVWVQGSSLSQCGPIEGFDDAWVGGDGNPLEPHALAITADGAGLAIGAAPVMAPTAGPGYGKVLWAPLDPSRADPCAAVGAVEDLTDGSSEHAPAVDTADVSTWRRAPIGLTLVEVG